MPTFSSRCLLEFLPEFWSSWIREYRSAQPVQEQEHRSEPQQAWAIDMFWPRPTCRNCWSWTTCWSTVDSYDDLMVRGIILETSKRWKWSRCPPLSAMCRMVPIAVSAHGTTALTGRCGWAQLSRMLTINAWLWTAHIQKWGINVQHRWFSVFTLCTVNICQHYRTTIIRVSSESRRGGGPVFSGSVQVICWEAFQAIWKLSCRDLAHLWDVNWLVMLPWRLFQIWSQEILEDAVKNAGGVISWSARGK